MTQGSSSWSDPQESNSEPYSPELVVRPRAVRSKRISDLVVVANRLPLQAVRSEEGDRWEQSPGGLVTALSSAFRRSQRNLWIGWSGSTEPVEVPDFLDSIRLRHVEFSASEVTDYYEGFSNASIWPLYHDSIETPGFHRSWWDAYGGSTSASPRWWRRRLPRGATCGSTTTSCSSFPRAPGALRPDLRIGFFLHIPFPSPELFLRVPWRTQIVEGILGADVVGFQTEVGTRNFRSVAAGPSAHDQWAPPSDR